MKATVEHQKSHHSNTIQNTPFFSPAFIQPAPTINEPGDQYEQEADAMSEKVMRMESTPGAPMDEEDQPIQMMPLAISRLQRKCAACGDEEQEHIQQMPLMRKATGGGYTASSQLTSQLSQSKGGGNSLPTPTRSYMSNAFGTDFSQVRVHTGSQAQEMSQGIQAKAFTHGSDIYFNQGEYSPESSDGKRLLAHELTHVVQQGGNYLKRIQRSSEDIDPCTYSGDAVKEREVHLNLGMKAARVFQTGGGHTQFDNLILGPSTSALARANGWCHMYSIKDHQRRSGIGLINFVNYCGNFGFHSNFWTKRGRIIRIPGTQSHGCARLHDVNATSTASDESNSFYGLVQNGDCVRIYNRSSWRNPTFKRCPNQGENCRP